MRLKSIKVFFILEITLNLVSCATNHGSVNSWADAGLVAGQQSEIERLQQDIANLRTQLGEAQQAARSSVESIDRVYAELESSLAGTASLQDSINALTEFAEQCLAEINRFREYQSENIGVQQADRGADAGAG
jgi:chromosome segregation ATPase